VSDPQQALHQEVYRTTFETWRYEVDSYWQRNSYFAAFQTAALAGCWYVFEHCYLWPALAFSGLGIASAIIWLRTSQAVHSYVRYWWDCMKEIETRLHLQDNGLAFACRHPGSGKHPSRLVHMIPRLFAAAWLVIFLLACRSLWLLWLLRHKA
jgi:hypothetical protein